MLQLVIKHLLCFWKVFVDFDDNTVNKYIYSRMVKFSGFNDGALRQ